MAVWRLAIAVAVVILGVTLGLSGPDTTPVDPGLVVGGGGPQ